MGGFGGEVTTCKGLGRGCSLKNGGGGGGLGLGIEDTEISKSKGLVLSTGVGLGVSKGFAPSAGVETSNGLGPSLMDVLRSNGFRDTRGGGGDRKAGAEGSLPFLPCMPAEVVVVKTGEALTWSAGT